MSKAVAPYIHSHEDDEKTYFGFWVYLMTDLVLFASLFATFAVLRNNTNGGPAAGELFSLPYVFAETLFLLTSSFTSGLALLAIRRNNKKQAIVLLGITFALGAAFLGLEIAEFMKLANEGNGWQRSGFLSSYFTLVGTHGLHITAGLIWVCVITAQMWQRGLTTTVVKRASLFSLFWHFLDIVWIFIFSVVYLLGALES